MNEQQIEYITHKIVNGDISLNPTEEWHKGIEADLRTSWLPAVRGTSVDNEEVATAVAYKADAIYYTIFRKVKTSRDGDFEFVCIRLPYFKNPNPDSLVKSLEDIKDYVRKNEITIPRDETVERYLSSILITSKDIAKTISYMQGNDYAFRCEKDGLYHYSFKEIIGAQYQDDYANYKVVFFLNKGDKPLGIAEINNLTDKPLKEYIWFSKDDIDGLHKNVSVYFKNEVLNTSIRVDKTAMVPLTFKKEGFLDIQKSIPAEGGNVGEFQWEFPVTKNLFYVIDKTNHTIDDFKAVLEGRDLPRNIFESNLGKNYNVSFSADGYETKTVSVSFSLGMKPVKVELKKMEVQYYIYPKERGVEPIQIIFPPSYNHLLHVGRSPFACYRIAGRNRKDNVMVARLVIDEEDVVKRAKEYGSGSKLFSKRLFKLLIPILSLLVALIVGALLGHYLWKSNTPSSSLNSTDVENVQSLSKETRNSLDKPTLDDRIKSANDYLNSHPVWVKDEMENHEPLKGVWDALNEYNYTKLQEVDNKYHFEATSWRGIISAIEAKDYQRTSKDAPLCKNGDTKITITDDNQANTFLYKIKEKVSITDNTNKVQQKQVSPIGSSSPKEKQPNNKKKFDTKD